MHLQPSNMKLTHLAEVSIEASLAIIRDELYQLSQHIHQIGDRVHDQLKNGVNKKQIHALFKGSLARWFTARYLSTLEPALRDLRVPQINKALSGVTIIADRELRSTLELSNFDNLISMLTALNTSLPGNADMMPAIRKQASEMLEAIDRIQDRIAAFRLGSAPSSSRTPAKASTTNSSLPAQSQAAEGIVNHVLASLDRTTAGEIRAAIAKRPNKLAALQHELASRGITL